jgi:hypothetical protein
MAKEGIIDAELDDYQGAAAYYTEFQNASLRISDMPWR